MKTDDRKALIKKMFNSLTKDNLEILDGFYAPNIDFTDPVGNVKGLENVKKYYAHVYKNVLSINFDFHQINDQGDLYFAKWTMTLQVAALNSGQPYDVEGLSVLQFNAKGLVESHRDYLDLGSMVYEHVPLLGRAIKLIKRNLS
ncbi:MAG: nuclear transport factor 2 family protein [Bdellovibrionaceae bacterium]|nr:nuclear transport factor 2 family protein [Pseudobdellovibrionaceae bacterium]